MINKTKFLIYLLVVVTLTNCQKATNNTSNNDLILVDTLKIPIGVGTPNYVYLMDNWDNNDETNVTSYNERKHAIDFFNLGKSTLYKSIKLESSGPEKFGRILGLHYHNADSIFIYELNKLSIINSDGNRLESFHLPDYFENKDFGDLIVSSNFELFFNKKRKSVYFYNLYSGDLTKAMDNPLIVEFDIGNFKLNYLPINYSDYNKSNNIDFGFLYHINATFNDDQITYNFPTEPNVYIYHFDQGKIISGQVKSKITSNFSPPTQNQPSELHAMESVTFFKTWYDDVNKKYLRLHWGDLNTSELDNGENGFLFKRLYLTQFSEDFDVIQELELPNFRYRSHASIFTNNGLYVGANHPKSVSLTDDYLIFDHYQ